MNKELNDISSFLDFLNSKGISFFTDRRCITANQKKYITDILYLNNQKQICSFEFRKEYDKIDKSSFLFLMQHQFLLVFLLL